MGVLQYFDNFFEKKPKEETSPQIGDIWWVPTLEVNEVPRIFEALRVAPQGHEITEFVIKEINQQHFTQRERLPIKLLTLAETEELIITKAKKRPVILLSSSSADVESVPIANSAHKRLAKKLTIPLYLVAPLASVSSMMKVTTFGPELVARIRAMHYPHLFCLPDTENKLEPKSIVRLDLAFSTYLARGCEPCGKKLHIEPLTVLLSQFAYLLGEVGSQEFQLVKKLVNESYP